MKLISRIRKLWTRSPVVAVIRLYGAIGMSGRFGPALSDHGLASQIERAFSRKSPDAIALAINSPGGSPVQSALIAARIRRLADEKDIPVYAFCEDAAASGGYWLASAADEIWADSSSVIGSIGVISAGFGLHELIERYGIERRVYTAGESKSMLDPFKPENPDDLQRLRELLDELHRNFISQVTTRRARRLVPGDHFDGAFWTGNGALERGLIDGIGHLVPVMKDKLGDKTRFLVTEPRKSLFQRLGAPGASMIVDALEDRALWARLGL